MLVVTKKTNNQQTYNNLCTMPSDDSIVLIRGGTVKFLFKKYGLNHLSLQLMELLWSMDKPLSYEEKNR